MLITNPQDGDFVGTRKLSIGCDATSRTALTGNLLAEELGLNGHNHFEADTSLTRNDYFLANGDNFRWNATVSSMAADTWTGTDMLAALHTDDVLLQGELRSSGLGLGMCLLMPRPLGPERSLTVSKKVPRSEVLPERC